MESNKINKGEKIYCPNCKIHGIEKLATHVIKYDAFGDIETPLCKECLKELIEENEDLISS